MPATRVGSSSRPLQSAIKSSAKPKKEKKKKKTWEDYDDLLDNADAAPEADGAAAPAEPLAAPTEMTAEELADQGRGAPFSIDDLPHASFCRIWWREEERQEGEEGESRSG